MSGIEPGWYKDPAEPTTQRWWDGEGWIGDPLPADATPPPGPPEPSAPQPPAAPGTPGGPEAAGNAPGGAGAESGPGSAGGGLPDEGPSPWAPGTPEPPFGYPPGHPYPSNQPHPPGQGFPPGPYPSGQGFPGGGGYPGYPAAPLPVPVTLLASPARRLAARLIDIFAVLVLNVLVSGRLFSQLVDELVTYWQEYQRRLAAGESTSGLPGSEHIGTLELMILLIAAAIWFAYEVPAVAVSGQTLGKRLVGIRVVSQDGPANVGFRRSWRRWNPMGLPVLLWCCLGIGVLLQFLDVLFVVVDTRTHQALHDRSARTVVVRAAPATEGRKDS